jgi:general nucleoside transport system permease protein
VYQLARKRLLEITTAPLRMLLTLLGALLFAALVILLAGASPLETYRLVFFGALSTPIRLADAVMLMAPLVLCGAALCVTFAAGLYNLGIEGQIGLGAIAAMIPLRLFGELPPPLLWLLALGAGAIGGALWALLAAGLRIYGRVSEIFAGLGLNFSATGLALYLVAGPWRKPGTASITSTEQLPEAVWLPTVGNLRLAPLSPILALVGLAIVWFLLTRTRWGLEVRATGLNPVAAERLGAPSVRRIVEAMLLCGVLAGIVGGLQVLAVFHALVPNSSSGLGLLALLVVLLIRSNPAWVLPISTMFALFSIGSIQLPLALNIDSSIAGVLQGALVLFALAGAGWRAR